MLVALLSDIHANQHALDAVLASTAAAGVDQYWFLGDAVGYGPDPAQCCNGCAAIWEAWRTRAVGFRKS